MKWINFPATSHMKNTLDRVDVKTQVKKRQTSEGFRVVKNNGLSSSGAKK